MHFLILPICLLLLMVLEAGITMELTQANILGFYAVRNTFLKIEQKAIFHKISPNIQLFHYK